MRVVTATQMAAIDHDTIAAGTPGLELMERAGRAICDALDEGGWLDDGGPIVIVCGKGNNGGDGFVMARVLAESDLDIRVLMLAPRDELSEDSRANHDRLPRSVRVVAGERENWADQMREEAAQATLVVDAVFGTGIEPPLREPYSSLFAAMNAAPAPVVAVDIPSGVSGDDGDADPSAVVADLTITMGSPKLGLLVPPGRDHVGELHVVDIGFPEDVVARHAADWHILGLDDYRAMLPARSSDMHKYDMGCLLAVAGSRPYAGASQLCGLGALRSGVGLLTMMVPEGIETALRVGLPEAILRVMPATNAGTLAPVMVQEEDALLLKKTAVAVGPGLGADKDTDGWVCRFAERCQLPLVLDADGLGAFARQNRTLRFESKNVVLTPHAGELARLTGVTADQIVARRLELAPELAARWQAVLVLKGSPTVIGLPSGKTVINPCGDDTLARGGTGDVLTGVIGSLLAQGCPAAEAAMLGVFLHGLAGDVAAEAMGRRGALVREIADGVAVVLRELGESRG